ncbi:MAG: family oxidoreductase [Solirubrobacterales bacterium]|nr:family oxidoreductase [Solirubrobacterales bacterium]
MGTLDGTAAVVTGGSHGIGLATARALLREGASVTICSRGQADVDAAVALLAADGPVHGVAADVSVRTDVERLFAEAEAAHGPVGALVCSHGVFFHAPFTELTDEAWDATFDVNAKGCFLAGQIAARSMIANGIRGRIVLIGSMNADRVDPGSGHYSASKAAVNLLAAGMARDLGPHGITVNAISPGWIRTRLTEAAEADRTDEQGRFILNPVERIGTGDDVAEAALYLIRQSGFVTAQILRVDGGQSMMGANGF